MEDYKITMQMVKDALPSGTKSVVTESLVQKLNDLNSGDPDIAKNIKDNFISYTQVLQLGKFTLDDYFYAIAFVTYKIMGMSNREAFMKTFPDRYEKYVKQGKALKDIDSLISAYNRNKLVNLIIEQSLIPSWILNQEIYQRAINVQAELMVNAKSERVRTQAADSLLNHLKKPELVDRAQLNINLNQNDSIKELNNTILNLVQRQQDLIKSGVTAKEIIEQGIIDAEYTEE